MTKAAMLLSIWLVSFTFCMLSCAQQSQTSIFQGNQPYKEAQIGSYWYIDIVYSNSIEKRSSGEDAGLHSIDPNSATRLEMWIGQNGIQKGLITYANLHQRLFYVVNGYVFQKYINSSNICISAVTSRSLPDPYSPLPPPDLCSPFFPAVNWISAQDYIGIESVEGKECYKFEKSGGQMVNALIDSTSHYPIRVQIENAVYTFSDIYKFTENVDLPSNYRDALKNLGRQIQGQR